MSRQAILTFLADAFAPVFVDDAISLTAADAGCATLELVPSARHLRPGGIVSGPTLMTLADAAAYCALLSLDEAAKAAVTANLSIAFLRPGPADQPIRLVATVTKPGRLLSVVIAEAFGANNGLLAHATITYAMPRAEPSTAGRLG